jgi:hypothetical protein
VRFALGLFLLGTAIIMAEMDLPGDGWVSRLVQLMVGTFGLFAILEAALGWCLARALGLKTPF